MPFFPPLPESEHEDEDEAKQQFFDVPGFRPQHWTPGLGPTGAVLARTATTAVVLRLTGSYPRGLSFAVQLLVHPESLVESSWRGHHGLGRSPMLGLRLGLQWADGSRVEAHHHAPSDDDSAPYRLRMLGGGGGGLQWEWTGWLTPLPPPEPVAVYVAWTDRGIPETRTDLDLAPVVRWADDAEELWPLPPPPQDSGWLMF